MRLPKYRKNPDGRAFVQWEKRRYYLGKWGSAASHRAYQRFLAKIEIGIDPNTKTREGKSIAEIAGLYLDHKKQQHLSLDKPTSTFHVIELGIRRLVAYCGPFSGDEFSGLMLETLQSKMIEMGYVRHSINQMVSHIRKMLKWAAKMEYIPIQVYQSACTVEGLVKGRSLAKENAPIRPVSWESVKILLPFLSRQVAALVQVQFYCGLRPGEALVMRAADLDMRDTIWIYRLEHHKTERHGAIFAKAVPLVAQEIIRPFLAERPADAFLFNPRDARRERYAIAKYKRRPMAPKKNCCYTISGYREAIRRAAKRAKLAGFHPNQLRHSIATEIRQTLGQQAAQVWLGHSSLDTTAIYAERQELELKRIAEQLDRKWSG